MSNKPAIAVYKRQYRSITPLAFAVYYTKSLTGGPGYADKGDCKITTYKTLKDAVMEAESLSERYAGYMFNGVML